MTRAASIVSEAVLLCESIHQTAIDIDVNREEARQVQVVEEAFRLSGHTSIRSVTCRYEPGVLVMEGRVGCYFDRQISFSIAKSCAPGWRIVDRITVSQH